jgi:hypothetical protein
MHLAAEEEGKKNPLLPEDGSDDLLIPDPPFT